MPARNKMEPLEAARAQAVLLDVLQTLKRLETGLHGQEQRMYAIERFVVRSGSVSPATISSTADSSGNDYSGRRDGASLQTETPATTPPRSPASLYRNSLEGLRQNFEFEDDCDIEDGTEPETEAKAEGGEYGDNDARSVSVYPRQLSRLTLDLDPRAIALDIPVPPRSPHRPHQQEHPEAQDGIAGSAIDNNGIQFGFIGLAYENALSGPTPSRTKPSEVYFRKRKAPRRSHGPFSLGPELKGRLKESGKQVLWQVKAWHVPIPHPGRMRQKEMSAVRPEPKKGKGAKTVQQHHGFGFRGFWRCVILVFTTTHRSRPYIVA